MDLQLDDKIVVVTGTSSGIGRATAHLLLAEGAVVVGVARRPSELGRSSRVSSITADLTDPAAPGRVIDTVLERHGRLDGLVNNAGGLALRASMLSITDEQWDATFALNLHAARRMSVAAMPALLNGGGSIVHVGSESAHLGSAFNPDYGAAKLALLSLSKSLATEFTPRGVRSNVVMPGMTRTELQEAPGSFGDQLARMLGTDPAGMIDQVVTTLRPLLTGRIATPEEVARVIAYLVSPLSSQVTGVEWAVDGGALQQV